MTSPEEGSPIDPSHELSAGDQPELITPADIPGAEPQEPKYPGPLGILTREQLDAEEAKWASVDSLGDWPEDRLKNADGEFTPSGQIHFTAGEQGRAAEGAINSGISHLAARDERGVPDQGEVVEDYSTEDGTRTMLVKTYRMRNGNTLRASLVYDLDPEKGSGHLTDALLTEVPDTQETQATQATTA